MRDWAIPTALLASKAENAGDLLALVIVAGHWNTSTREAHPGTRRVADLCHCSQSAATKRLARLVASGDLIVSRAGHGNYATRYRVPALENGPGTNTPDVLVPGVNEHPRGNRFGVPDAERVLPRSERVPNEHPRGYSEVVRDEVDLERVDESLRSLNAYRDAIAGREPDFSDSYALLDGGQICGEPEPLPVATDEERDRVRDTVAGLRDSLGFRRSPTRKDLA